MTDILSDVLTIPQQLSLFREHTGLTFNIRPFERVLKVRLEDTGAAILVSTYQIRQMARGWRLLKKGERLVSFAPASDGTWKQIGKLDVWDESFEPITVSESGRSRSVLEWIDQMRWERSCYRLGDGNLAEQVEEYRNG